MLPVESPFKIYTDLNGKPLNNGYIYIGQPDQNPITAPVTVYWDAAGTIPAAQPLRTENGYIYRAGSPANVFFDGPYSELVRDARQQLVAYGSNSSQFGVSSLAGSAGASLVGYGSGSVRDYLDAYSLNSIAALRLVNKAKVSRAMVSGYYASRDGGGGMYTLDSSDSSTPDNGGTVIVGADGGRWKLVHDGSVTVKQFGAKSDGTTDCQTYIQAALASGLIVNFSRETYQISASIVIPDSAWVVGNGCVIRPTAGLNAFTTATGAQDIHLHGLQVVGNGASISAFVIDSARTWISECTTTNVTNGVVSRAASFYMSDCDIRATGTALTFETNAEVRSVESCILTSTGTCVVINGGADLRIVNCDLLAGNLCMLINPTSGEVSSLKVIGVFFDQGVQGGIKILPTGTGTCRRFTFDSYWFTGSTSGDGVSAIGNIAGLMFSHGEVYGNSGNGFSFGSGVTSVTITGSHIAGNGSRGITAGNVNGLTITGNTIGPASGYPGNGVGVEITAGTDNYMITGNRIGGNGTNIADGGSGVNKLISNNL